MFVGVRQYGRLANGLGTEEKYCLCPPPMRKHTEMQDTYSDDIVAMPLNAFNDASYTGV